MVIGGYSFDEVIFGRTTATSDDLVLTFQGTEDRIQINNTLNGSSSDTIEEIAFEDGTVLTPSEIRVLLLDVASTGGNDIIGGFTSEDTLEGGLGNDTLNGGDGSDTYIFNRGDGQDIIEDNGFRDTDRVVIGGYDIEDVTISRTSTNSNDLVLSFTETGDQITIFNTLDGSSSDEIEEVVFEDGTIFTSEFLNTLLLANQGTDGSDVIQGNSHGDIIDGGLGDDVLIGEAGADRLDGGAGSDTLTGGVGNDIFVFAENSEQTVITDFTAGDDIVGVSNSLFADLSSVIDAAIQSGNDVIVNTDGSEQLVINNVQLTDLDQDDFIFV